jgi:hypothetical protein
MAKPTYEELEKQLKEAKEKANGGPISFKVSEKGGCSVYGLGRFPLTLYWEQWQKLLANLDSLKKFLEDNKNKFKLKS